MRTRFSKVSVGEFFRFAEADCFKVSEEGFVYVDNATAPKVLYAGELVARRVPFGPGVYRRGKRWLMVPLVGEPTVVTNRPVTFGDLDVGSYFCHHGSTGYKVDRDTGIDVWARVTLSLKRDTQVTFSPPSRMPVSGCSGLYWLNGYYYGGIRLSDQKRVRFPTYRMVIPITLLPRLR